MNKWDIKSRILNKIQIWGFSGNSGKSCHIGPPFPHQSVESLPHWARTQAFPQATVSTPPCCLPALEAHCEHCHTCSVFILKCRNMSIPLSMLNMKEMWARQESPVHPALPLILHKFILANPSTCLQLNPFSSLQTEYPLLQCSSLLLYLESFASWHRERGSKESQHEDRVREKAR